MNREVAHDFSPKLMKKLQQHATRNFLGQNNTKLHNKSITASNKKKPSVES